MGHNVGDADRAGAGDHVRKPRVGGGVFSGKAKQWPLVWVYVGGHRGAAVALAGVRGVPTFVLQLRGAVGEGFAKDAGVHGGHGLQPCRR